jgi:thiol-disulfide isomerase/thioredoxin
MNLVLTLALQLTTLAPVSPGDESYKHARDLSEKTGKPLVILVGAEWCPACVTMKKKTIPEVKKSKIFKKVNYAEVDYDTERNLAKQLTEGGKIPQLMVFRKAEEGWKVRKVIGGKSPDAVKTFIAQSIEKSEKEKARKTNQAVPVK